MDQPTAEKALKELEPLVGEWTLWREDEPFPKRTNYETDFDLTYRKVK